MTDESVVIHDADADTYRDGSGPLTIGGGGPPSGAAGGVLSGTYPDPSFAADMATQAELDAHTGDTTDAHDASAVSIADAGAYYSGANVEAALQEIGAGGIGGLAVAIETPAGTVDGSNDTFTLSVDPDPPENLLLFRDGLLMEQDDDYTLTGDTIVFTVPPATGSTLLAGLPATGGGGGVGTELDYAEYVGDRTITATSAATADTVIDGGAVTYDGSTRIKIEFYARFAVLNSTLQYLIVNLWDGSTDLGRIAQLRVATDGGTPLSPAVLLTPSAGAHTYHVKAWVTAGTGTVFGNNTDPGFPIHLRITEA